MREKNIFSFHIFLKNALHARKIHFSNSQFSETPFGRFLGNSIAFRNWIRVLRFVFRIFRFVFCENATFSWGTNHTHCVRISHPARKKSLDVKRQAPRELFILLQKRIFVKLRNDNYRRQICSKSIQATLQSNWEYKKSKK